MAIEGSIFALLAAACFSSSQVFARRGVSWTGESFSAVPVSISVGTLLFFLLVCFTDEWGRLWHLPWRGLALLGAAGILHFVIGRFFNYSCLRLVGANIGGALLTTNILYAAAFGVIFLVEPFTILLVSGILSIGVGVILVSYRTGGKATVIQAKGKGIIFGLLAGLCYGASGLLIKMGMVDIDSPLTGAFISYVAAFLSIVAILLFRKEQRQELARLGRSSLCYLALAGLFVSLAQLFRYVALEYSPLSVVSPLMSTTGLFTLLFSFLLNRDIEVFTTRVILGVVATVLGAFLLF